MITPPPPISFLPTKSQTISLSFCTQTCSPPPAASSTAPLAATAGSTHSICLNSSSPKSAIPLALAAHGFQTPASGRLTVSSEMERPPSREEGGGEEVAAPEAAAPAPAEPSIDGGHGGGAYLTEGPPPGEWAGHKAQARDRPGG